MTKILSIVNAFVWGAPALILILGVGIYLTVRLDFVQLRLLPEAFRKLARSLRSGSSGGVSPVQALCTALAATVGTGNLVGVAGAICLGGPGAVFWMWISGLLGMATKYAEAVLAVRFRVKKDGGYAGGPMYVMVRGLGEAFRPLACVYALFGVMAAFGVGNATQIGSAVAGINGILRAAGLEESRIGNLLTGAVLAAVIGRLLLGGAKRIGAAAERLIPFAAAVYAAMCSAVLILRADAVPGALYAIVSGGFSPRAVTGGLLGSAFQALRIGCSRGVFTNEAGMGTASIAHASAEVTHPAEQGLMGILEVFLDTIVICTLTALAILVSGVPVPYGQDLGAELTGLAFSGVLGSWASVFIGGALVLFACATVLGWGLYGARCAEFLFGPKAWKWFSAAQILTILIASVADTADLWLLAETVNGLMALPNLIALAMLAPEVSRLTKEYIISDGKTVSGGNYADFHQRKPLRTLSYEKVPPSGCGSQERGQKDLSSEHRSA